MYHTQTQLFHYSLRYVRSFLILSHLTFTILFFYLNYHCSFDICVTLKMEIQLFFILFCYLFLFVFFFVLFFFIFIFHFSFFLIILTFFCSQFVILLFLFFFYFLASMFFFPSKFFSFYLSPLPFFSFFLYSLFSTFYFFLNSILFFQISQLDAAARSRSIALKCLLKIRNFPYPKIHPYKNKVVKGVGKVTDDRKRAIRLLAARVRNEWLILGLNE